MSDQEPDLRQRLTAMIDDAEWGWLQPHARRDVIIVVTPGLDLLEVGISVAEDDSARIESWIETKRLAKPTPAQVAEWTEHPETPFRSLIVQPYVLIQPKPLH